METGFFIGKLKYFWHITDGFIADPILKATILEQNELYPIFLKVAELEVLIVGGGNVGLEKLTFLLESSPKAKVTLVGKMIIQEVSALAADFEDKVNKMNELTKEMIKLKKDK